MKPVTRYTKSSKINIAYQVFGKGSIDLVYIPGWISNIDMMWACPELVSFLKELGKMARVILFDKRGTGLSDRMSGFPTLEERMDDIRAVMDAVDSDKAVLFGHSEGGSVSALFAATYPDRTISLITFGIFARRSYHPKYPWAPTPEERQKVYDMIENNWGEGSMNLESLAPSKAGDPVFMEWLASYFRSGASPGAALMLTKLNTQVDIIEILDAIKVPSLIMQRIGDIDVKIEEGQFIAAHINDAKFVALEGEDHLFWVGNTDEILKEIRTFIGDLKPDFVYEKRLFTILAGYFEIPEYEFEKCNTLIKQLVSQNKGLIVKQTRNKIVALFDGPSKAVLCGENLLKATHPLHASFSLGLHIKECFVDNPVCSEIDSFIDLIMHEHKDETYILATQTIKNLLVGSEVSFGSYPLVYRTDTNQKLQLYSIHPGGTLKGLNKPENNSKRKDTGFLNLVVRKIEYHLANDQFGVEMLCNELSISERQLQRKLKLIANKSPNRLILSVRLQRARELLLAQQDTISEIAFKTGFTNPSYFSKCFKKEFNISPSDFVRTYN